MGNVAIELNNPATDDVPLQWQGKQYAMKIVAPRLQNGKYTLCYSWFGP